jgi:hypothetical protein
MVMLSSSVVLEVRARLFGCPRAEIPSRAVCLMPSIRHFFRLLSGLDPTSKEAVTSAFAHDMFTVSNDPERQDERDTMWRTIDRTPCRSLSVGDVVEVHFGDGTKWMAVCLSAGWFVGVFDQALINKLEAGQAMFDREDAIHDLVPNA